MVEMGYFTCPTSIKLKVFSCVYTLKVLVMTVDDWDTFKQDNYSIVEGEVGCRVGEV